MKEKEKEEKIGQFSFLRKGYDYIVNRIKSREEEILGYTKLSKSEILEVEKQIILGESYKQLSKEALERINHINDKGKEIMAFINYLRYNNYGEPSILTTVSINMQSAFFRLVEAVSAQDLKIRRN